MHRGDFAFASRHATRQKTCPGRAWRDLARKMRNGTRYDARRPAHVLRSANSIAPRLDANVATCDHYAMPRTHTPRTPSRTMEQRDAQRLAYDATALTATP